MQTGKGLNLHILTLDCFFCKENCTKERTSFVSFKLWRANKQSESGIEGNGEIGLNDEKSRQPVPQGSTDDHDGQHCGVTAQTIISPQASDLVIVPSLH